jgi:hypothetical protein
VNRITRAAAALGVRRPRNIRVKLAKLAALLISLTGLTLPGLANAVTLGTASVTMSDARPSIASVNYTFKVGDATSPVTASAVKCVKVVFATTSTDTAGVTAPTGFNSSGVTNASLATSTLVNSSSTGWTATATDGASSTGQGNIVTYTNSTGVTPSTTQGATLIVNNVTNSSIANTAYYAFFNTYGNTNCSSSPIDTTTVEFINTTGSAMSLTIDNTLSFTVAGHTATSCGTTGVSATVDNSASPNTIPFGTVTTSAISCQALTAATNATNGFTIYIRDQAQLANTLGQKIPDVGSSGGSYTNGNTNASPGSFTNNTSSLATYPGFNQGAYGYTTDDATLGTGTVDRFTNGGAKWASYGHGTSDTVNKEIAYEPVGVTSTTYNVAHQVGITALTQPGVYTTTVVYTCVPVY